MLPNDAMDATLPTESTESWEQIERTEFSDQSDHTLRRLAPYVAHPATPTPDVRRPLVAENAEQIALTGRGRPSCSAFSRLGPGAPQR